MTKVELFVVLLAAAMTVGIPLPMALMAWRTRRLKDQLRRVSNPPVLEQVSLDDKMMAAFKRRDGSLVAYAKPDMVRYGGYGVVVLVADDTGVHLFRNALRDPSPIVTLPWRDVSAIHLGERSLGARVVPTVVLDLQGGRAASLTPMRNAWVSGKRASLIVEELERLRTSSN